jgi:nucleoside-diphosphate kinase
MEETLVLLKFDALERGLSGAILARYEEAGFRVAKARWLRPPCSLWEEHYADLKSRNQAAFDRTTRCLADKPVLAIILNGRNVVQKIRQLNGPTDPLQAPPGTIRGDFSSDSITDANRENRATFNLVHAADSPESAQREIAVWFRGMVQA